MKNIYIKRGLICGTSSWVTNKRHKLKDGEHIRIMEGTKEVGHYIVRHTADYTHYCDGCPLNKFNGTKLCVFKLGEDVRHCSLCSDSELRETGTYIAFVDINTTMENL